MPNHLIVEHNGPILSITLNRPESLNAFSAEMITSLTDSIREAAQNPNVRVVVLSGAGRAFSAGGDVKTMGQVDAVQVYEHIGHLNECIIAMKSLQKPIIAAVHGFAAGAGFNLALASDLIVAAIDTKFILSFQQVGLVSDGGGSYFLPHLVGVHKAKELLMTGEAITAEEAQQLGIVNKVFSLDTLQEETTSFALKLAKGPSLAFGQMKKIVDQALTSNLSDILEQERITQTMMIASSDHLEGVNAFKEKRRPHFLGK
ncbi:enoyl-CoA hydratase [Bacillus sp. HMF5848]|uniref:enoyl-CoA hydratase/isomerase family protein n=1 Tax=Bacillus sp. HMF5848 TaxID=2495421 RepID=UPI000F7B25DF|nr:enoyl-CoA hydratase [Bacillus sp. HMF5848]RSK27359.1 enoyl-CoA hydratase [Bacillus sp. HMF5848]